MRTAKAVFLLVVTAYPLPLWGGAPSLFLFAELMTFLITKNVDGQVVFNCYDNITDDEAELIVRQMMRANPYWGLSCSDGEYNSKNRVEVNFGQGSVEGWVGRSTSIYLPGLYWITVISRELASKHNIEIDDLRNACETYFEVDDILLFKFYENSNDWRDRQNVIELSKTLTGVFDIELVKNALLGCSDIKSCRDVMRNWR